MRERHWENHKIRRNKTEPILSQKKNEIERGKNRWRDFRNEETFGLPLEVQALGKKKKA